MTLLQVMSPERGARLRAAAGVLGVVLAVGSGLILWYGQAPARVWWLLIENTWGVGYGVGQVLFKSTPLIFAGLGVALALRAGLFNIGAEGQLLMGGLGAALLGAHLGGWPAFLAVPLTLAAAALAGGAWGAFAGLLRAELGISEVITTILLNFIAAALASWLGSQAGLYVPETQHTVPIALSARLPRLDHWVGALKGSAVSGGLLVALLACLIMAWVLHRSRFGYELRAVGKQPPAAQAAGISLWRMAFLPLAIAGALAGLGGANFVLGYKYYFEAGFSSGAGFLGIAVAVLAGSNPLAVIPAALLLGTLSQGGLAIHHLVPKEILDVLEAVVLLAVAVGTGAKRRSP